MVLCKTRRREKGEREIQENPVKERALFVCAQSGAGLEPRRRKRVDDGKNRPGGSGSKKKEEGISELKTAPRAPVDLTTAQSKQSKAALPRQRG